MPTPCVPCRRAPAITACGTRLEHLPAAVTGTEDDPYVGVLRLYVSAPTLGRMLRRGLEERALRVSYDDAALHWTVLRLAKLMFESRPEGTTLVLGGRVLLVDDDLAADVAVALLRFVIRVEARPGGRGRPQWH